MDFLGDLAGFEADFNQIYYIYSRFGIELLGFPWCLVSIESLDYAKFEFKREFLLHSRIFESFTV